MTQFHNARRIARKTARVAVRGMTPTSSVEYVVGGGC